MKYVAIVALFCLWVLLAMAVTPLTLTVLLLEGIGMGTSTWVVVRLLDSRRRE